MQEVGVGIIGAGLMGRELGSALCRWLHLTDVQVKPVLRAVCDTNEALFDWFRQMESVTQFATDYREMLENPATQVIYVAVPHNLHERIYSDVLAAGKDLMGEKPFGIDVAACERIVTLTRQHPERFVRCSSEFPFFPAAKRIADMVQKDAFGRLLEVKSSFLHSSDLNPHKAINWKRRAETCGDIGVMGDLGMHTLHLPLRFGWQPTRIYADLENIVPERPDGAGKMVVCDTWDNATLHCRVAAEGYDFPMTVETKRIAPGEMNTWRLEVLGSRGGARFSTKQPKTLHYYTYAPGQDEQPWSTVDIGYDAVTPTITGGIFEFGFGDALLQMWAAYFGERAGETPALTCVTPEEALMSHRIFAAALESQREARVVTL